MILFIFPAVEFLSRQLWIALLVYQKDLAHAYLSKVFSIIIQEILPNLVQYSPIVND